MKLISVLAAMVLTLSMSACKSPPPADPVDPNANKLSDSSGLADKCVEFTNACNSNAIEETLKQARTACTLRSARPDAGWICNGKEILAAETQAPATPIQPPVTTPPATPIQPPVTTPPATQTPPATGQQGSYCTVSPNQANNLSIPRAGATIRWEGCRSYGGCSNGKGFSCWGEGEPWGNCSSWVDPSCS